MEDIDSVIMLSIEETYNFYYVMGFAAASATSSAKQQQLNDSVRAIQIETEPSTIEMVLARGVSESFACNGDGWTEQQWEQYVEDHVEGKLIRVQTSCAISKDAGGAACIDRIIAKHIRVRGDPSLAPSMLDCYREASGGRMHYLDSRPWKMSTIAQLGMECELQTTKHRISILTLKARDTNARIQYTQTALHCARIMANDAAVIEVLEQDLHRLEAMESEIMYEVANLHDLAHRHATVLHFQQQLAAPSKKRARNDDDDEE